MRVVEARGDKRRRSFVEENQQAIYRESLKVGLSRFSQLSTASLSDSIAAMIALLCLLAVARLSNCLDDLPTRREIETSINRTIDEVERMLHADSNLPRLSRSEIVDILFNITTGDMKNYEENVVKTREDYHRALTVVLPDNSTNYKDQKSQSIKIIQEPSTSSIETSKNLISTKTKDGSNNYKNHRETYTELAFVPTDETIASLVTDKSLESSPQKFSFNLDNLAATKKEELKFPSKTNLAIIYGTSVTGQPSTKTLETTRKILESFRPTMPPGKTQDTLTSDQWRYYAPPSKNTLKSSGSSVDPEEPTSIPLLTTTIRESARKGSKPQKSSSGQSEPQKDSSPWDMENLRIVDENAKPVSVYVTPMSSTTSDEPQQNSLSTEKIPETIKSTTPMREEVQELLASIGLRPKIGETKNQAIFGNFQIPDSSNVIPGHASGLTATGIESSFIGNQNTFERTPQDVKKGVENLSPDVQLLFQRFGLQSPINDPVTKATTVQPRTIASKISFWNNFKPLPVSEVKDEGMKSFLATFGLGVKTNRDEKSMRGKKNADNKPSLIEAVPDNMKKILENIGLITRSRRPVEHPRIETTTTPELHVFKPHETSINDEKQRHQINQLLDTVKLVQEGKADVTAVQKAAQELLETTKTLKNGPDPLSLEEILKVYNEDLKNEIKRQQDSSDLKDTTMTNETTESSTTTTTTTTTSPLIKPDPPTFDSSASSSDSSGTSQDSLSLDSLNDAKEIGILGSSTENSNLEALAESFGGSTAAPDPILPTPRKTGLYFLVDWNTFLKVGEEDSKDLVDLKFQPKAGDRTRFLPVTVP